MTVVWTVGTFDLSSHPTCGPSEERGQSWRTGSGASFVGPWSLSPNCVFACFIWITVVLENA